MGGTSFGWARNLRTGEPVDIRLNGKLRDPDVEVVTDENGVVGYDAIVAADNRQFAKFNQIRVGGSGVPNRADLRGTWRGRCASHPVPPDLTVTQPASVRLPRV